MNGVDEKIEYHSGGRMGKRSFRKEVEILSDMEKKQLEDAAKMISHLDRELPKETKLMWLAFPDEVEKE